MQYWPVAGRYPEKEEDGRSKRKEKEKEEGVNRSMGRLLVDGSF